MVWNATYELRQIDMLFVSPYDNNMEANMSYVGGFTYDPIIEIILIQKP